MAGTHALGGAVTSQTIVVSLLAAEVEVADAVLGTIYVPNKATILDVILEVTDMDTGATLEIDVGDSSGPATPDDNRFIDQFSGQAAGSIRASDSSGLLEGTYTYRNLKGTDDAQIEQAIEATIAAVAATGADGTLTLTVVYFVAQ